MEQYQSQPMEEEFEKELEKISNLTNGGLNVLIIGYDQTSLATLEERLQICNYNVTKCQTEKEAKSTIQEDPNRFKVIMMDLDLPNVERFEALKYLALTMNLLVIMMITNPDDDLIKKGFVHGACDILIKPIREEDVKYLWKHVYKKQRQSSLNKEIVKSPKSCSSDLVVSKTKESNGKRKHGKKRKVVDDTPKDKKPRMTWTPELHGKFVNAIKELQSENENPFPRFIAERMNIEGVTRDHVGSHLQKFRNYIKRDGQADSIMQLKCRSSRKKPLGSCIPTIDKPNLQGQASSSNARIQPQKNQLQSDYIMPNAYAGYMDPQYNVLPNYEVSQVGYGCPELQFSPALANEIVHASTMPTLTHASQIGMNPRLDAPPTQGIPQLHGGIFHTSVPGVSNLMEQNKTSRQFSDTSANGTGASTRQRICFSPYGGPILPMMSVNHSANPMHMKVGIPRLSQGTNSMKQNKASSEFLKPMETMSLEEQQFRDSSKTGFAVHEKWPQWVSSHISMPHIETPVNGQQCRSISDTGLAARQFSTSQVETPVGGQRSEGISNKGISVPNHMNPEKASSQFSTPPVELTVDEHQFKDIQLGTAGDTSSFEYDDDLNFDSLYDAPLERSDHEE